MLAIDRRCTIYGLLFETISTFATVGLGKDLTPHLKDITKVFIIILMFIGRVGLLRLFFFL